MKMHSIIRNQYMQVSKMERKEEKLIQYLDKKNETMHINNYILSKMFRKLKIIHVIFIKMDKYEE